MSLGIDIGNDFMVVTAVRQGVDVLQNDIGKRKTRVCVTYGADERNIGDDAYATYVSKFSQSALYFKRLLGKQYGLDDADIAQEKHFIPNKLTQPDNNNPEPQSVMYQLPRVGILPPEQALCTMLLKAKQIYEINSEGQPVQECVITVPTYFNNAQRQAVVNAADMANLKVLEYTNETTAILYQYCLQRRIEQTRHVLFYDLGATALNVSLAKINPETAEILAYEYDAHLGGRDFIEIIVDDVVKWCKQQKNVTIEPNTKQWLKIRRACEKTLHTLSANGQARITIENVTDSLDVGMNYKRDDFNAVVVERFQERLLAPIQAMIEQYPALVKDGKLQVDSVEIIGGATRIPFVQQLLTDTYGVTMSKTLDADEALACGAALRCAALSTTKKMRKSLQVIEKKVHVDLSVYPAPQQEGVELNEKTPLAGLTLQPDTVVVHKKFQAAYPVAYPQPRVLSIRCAQVTLPVVVGIRLNHSAYDNVRCLILPESKIDGRLLTELPGGQGPMDIKVSVSLNSSGFLTVCHAETIPPKPAAAAPQPVAAEAPAADAAEQADAAAAAAPAADAEKDVNMTDTPAPAAPAAEAPAMTDAIPEAFAKPIPLCGTVLNLGNISATEYTSARESESELQKRDQATRERQEAYNSLESHLFTIRSRLSDPEDIVLYLNEKDVEKAREEIGKILQWVDDEGWEAPVDVLHNKLSEARSHTHAGEKRMRSIKNLESSHFAYKSSFENARQHQHSTQPKFAKYFTEHEEALAKAKQALEMKLHDTLPITAEQVDQKHAYLRNLLAEMNKFDPEKERQRLEAEAAAADAAAAAQAAAASAQQNAQAAAAEAAAAAAAATPAPEAAEAPVADEQPAAEAQAEVAPDAAAPAEDAPVEEPAAAAAAEEQAPADEQPAPAAAEENMNDTA